MVNCKCKAIIISACIAVMMILLSASSIATASEMWTEWGYNDAGTQNMLYDSDYIIGDENFTQYSQSSYGTNYQPLVADLDLDGKPDIVVQSANFLNIYNASWTLLDQKAVNLVGQPTLTSTVDLKNDGLQAYESYIVANNDSHVFIYDYNGTINELYSLNVTLSQNISLNGSGFKCFYESYITSEICIAKYLRYNESLPSRRTRINGGFMSLIIPATCHNTTCITNEFYDFVDLNNTIVTIPNFNDIDNSGSKNVIFWSDFNQDESIGFSVFETIADSRLLYKDDLIDLSAAGLTSTVTNNYGSNNPIMYDLNTGGHSEIYFSRNRRSNSWVAGTSTDGATMYCYDSTGTACAGFNVNVISNYCPSAPNSHDFVMSNIVINEVDGEEKACVLASGTGCGGAPYSQIAGVCVDASGNIDHTSDISRSTSLGTSQLFATGADFNNDGNDDLLTHRYVVDMIGQESLLNYTTEGYVISGDFNIDGFLDLIGTNTSEMGSWLSSGSNTGATINEISSDTGSPSCHGNTVTYTVTDYTDAEFNPIRLRIDCYANGTYTSWSSSSYAPSQSCTFNRYGSFETSFQITDSANYPTVTDTESATWNVDIGNCYETGEDGIIVIGISANITGFNDFFINETALELNKTGGAYTSKYFGWEASGCEEWGMWKGVCPLWTWIATGAEKVWDKIFGAFAIFLTILLIIVIIAFFFKHKEEIIR